MKQLPEPLIANLQNAAQRFGTSAFSGFSQGQFLQGSDGEVHWAPPATIQLIESADPKTPWALVGTKVARIVDGRVDWTLEGGKILAAHASKAMVRLTPKAVQLFLCGRDVLPEGVLSRHEMPPHGLVIVLNPDREFLGLARIIPPGQRRFLEPILDLGWYLREGG